MLFRSPGVLLRKRIDPTPYWERQFPRSVTQALLLDRTSRVTPTVAPRIPTRHGIPLDDSKWCHLYLVMYSAQTMVRAQILRYISRPKYTRQSPDCPLVIFSFTALPSCLHCSTLYSSAFAQHCIVAHPPLPISCTRVHPHRFYPPRVSPSDPVSLLQVRPLFAIDSESQHAS